MSLASTGPLKECGYVQQVRPVWIISNSGLIAVVFPPEPQASGPRVTGWILKKPGGTKVSDSAYFLFFFGGYVTSLNAVLVQTHCYQWLVSLCLCAKQKHSSGEEGGGETGEIFCCCWGRRGRKGGERRREGG